MKKFFEKIVKADPIMKSFVILAIGFIIVNTGFNKAEAITTITDYVPAINIRIKDGTGEETGYLVKQASVEEILTSLNITLNEEDYTDLSLDTVLVDEDVINIYRVTYTTDSTTEEIPYTTEYVTGSSSVSGTRVAQEGQTGTLQYNYSVKLVNGEEVERTLVSQEVVEESVNTVVEYNTIGVGTTFTGTLTTYGADCVGCTGRTSAGAVLSSNGVNGSGSAKITYQGQEYYVLAADSSIPLCSIIEITNHSLGIESTAYGIVLDRGGAINGNHLDIFCGLENGNRFFGGSTSYKTTFKIISIGRGTAYCFNQ